jgi:diguanylate cyclase (GGDEF)-like protein
LAQSIRETVESVVGFETAGRADYRVTASLGMSMVEFGADTAANLLDQADQALYVAKQTGRNRVVIYQQQAVETQAETEMAH